MQILVIVSHTVCARPNFFGGGRWDLPIFGGMADSRETPLPPSYHARFGRSRSNRMGTDTSPKSLRMLAP